MKYVSMAIVGLIVGILARFFYPGAVQLGWLVSIALGIGGSFIAGFIGSLLDKQPGTALRPAGFILRSLNFSFPVIPAPLVIPAEAGIQKRSWIPAFAGMTNLQ